jgi:hypothetical protein
LAELKKALLAVGANEEQASQFIKKWLLDRIEIIFPTMNKISEIGILK